MSETVEKMSTRMFELQSQNTAAMAAQRQSTDERFYQEAEQRLNSSQCYRALLQGTGEAVTKMELSIRYLLGDSSVTRKTLDFIIGRM